MPNLGIYSGIKNSVDALESALRIAMANADNFNSPGYKYLSASFSSMFSEMVRPATETTNPISTGSSIALTSTNTDFSQGSATIGDHLAMAIIGTGFFICGRSWAARNQQQIYTRNGKFTLDISTNCVTDSMGRQLLGYKIKPDGTPDTSHLVPMDTTGYTDVGFVDGGKLVSNVSLTPTVGLNANRQVEGQTALYQVALTNFTNKQGLMVIDGGGYIETISSGPSYGPHLPDTGEYGSIKSKSLEGSNIDVARISLDMNQLSRGFTAIQGIIDDVNKIFDKMMQALSF